MCPAYNAHASYYIVIDGLLGIIILVHIISSKSRYLKRIVIEHNIYVLIFFTILSETFLIRRRTERDMIENVYLSSCKVSLILVKFHWNVNFLVRFSTNNQISNFIKTVQWEPNCSAQKKKKGRETVGRTDMTKPIVAFFSILRTRLKTIYRCWLCENVYKEGNKYRPALSR